MKFVKRIGSVFEIFTINNKIFLVDNEKKEIINISQNNHLPISYVKHTKNYFYDILVGQIVVYDDSFRIASKIIDPENMQFNSSIEENADGWILMLSKRSVEEKLMAEFKIIRNEEILHQNWYCGKILSNNFLLHFKYEERFNPSYFRCSDLLDTKTHCEYECEEGNQATNLWIVRNDNLIFCEKKSDNFAGVIVKVHLTSGQIVWKSEIANTNLHYNEEQGLLISFWASEVNGENYQIIDIDNQTIDFGETKTSYKLENVNTNPGTQYLHQRKLYFADQIMSISGETPRPVKFGCFDIDTKKIDFLQEIPEATGTAISQIIYNENTLYIRTWCNRLFIYE